MKHSYLPALLGSLCLMAPFTFGSSDHFLPTEDCDQPKVLPQFDLGTFEVLTDEKLVIPNKDETGTKNTDLVAASVALGVERKEDEEPTTILEMLKRQEKKIAEIDCAVHGYARRLALLRAEDRAFSNIFADMMGKIRAQYQVIQSFIIANGCINLEALNSFKTDEEIYELLKRRTRLCTEHIQSTQSPFTSPYPPIHLCLCGRYHEEGTLCDRIAVLGGTENRSEGGVVHVLIEGDNPDVVDLAPLHYTSYDCACGEVHEFTQQCRKNLPVYIAKLAEYCNTDHQDIASLETAIAGYISPDKVWHKINTPRTEPTLLCDKQTGYLCQCGQWHIATWQCGQWNHEKKEYSSYYPVYRGKSAGYICSCGSWHALNEACAARGTAYLCQCGSMHYSTNSCLGNNGQPFAVVKDGISGFICAPGHWHPLNTVCRSGLKSTSLGKGGYLCQCGQWHADVSECPQNIDVNILEDKD